MSQDPKALMKRALQAMESREPAKATAALEEFIPHLRKGPPISSSPLRDLWTSFSRLLEHRGFSTGAVQNVRTSLREIQDAGRGFDLFELAKAIARCDVTVTLCLKAATSRQIPELTPFQSECDCGRH